MDEIGKMIISNYSSTPQKINENLPKTSEKNFKIFDVEKLAL